MTVLEETFYRDCWKHWCDTRSLNFVVQGKIPIPYFGNIAAYMNSDIRVATVALNPNRDVFDCTASERSLEEEETEQRLSTYFIERQENGEWPGWFSNYQHILKGMGHSFLSSTQGAVHVDLCSPIATDPTWADLDKEQKRRLIGPGRRLFTRLYEILKPDIVIVSVASEHLKAIWGHPSGEPWKTLLSFHLCKDGATPRARPYDVKYRLYKARDEAPALIVFGIAANTPFGNISTRQKHEVGAAIMNRFRSIRIPQSDDQDTGTL